MYKSVLSPKILPYGKGQKGILNIGEAPGESEDRRGKPWQGKAGRRLQFELSRLKIDLFEDCLNTNSVNCRPPNNNTPTGFEIDCCRAKIVNPAIQEYKPKVIILYGSSALDSIMRLIWGSGFGGISKWRGFTIPCRQNNAWVCPVFHPSYVERMDQQEITTIWRQDLKRAISRINEPFPNVNGNENSVTLLEDFESIESTLRRIINGDEGNLVAFDYETTGVKPQGKEHRIVAVSLSTGKNTYAFIWPKDSYRCLHLWKRFLKSNKIGKIAHNIKFEHAWSVVHLDTEPQNWVLDTMLAAHLIDNRTGITGLKFQTYINFGVVGYDSEINPYLKGMDSKNANSLNSIDKFIKYYGSRKLLVYCGLDSLFTFQLAQKQLDSLDRIYVSQINNL
ncbi:MAG: hypothetical protein GWN40_03290 [Nitrosopumilaceae archaeon]|nr:hypothetical protein [Nitrosopumilaceae archaeon]